MTISSLTCIILLLGSCCFLSHAQQFTSQCDKPRNANLPFCDSSLPTEARVSDLIFRLTLAEKIGLLVHETEGATQNVDLDSYNWWNEGLKGVADAPGAHFRPPTEYSTVFPQPINLASSFSKELFFQVGNITGNEARAFFNVGNGGLTYWSPNINIYRDPRWGRGHETPGEDPRLSTEFARYFIRGLQGDESANGFLKTSACCKHFAAHSLENDRFTFDAVVNEQDMADTYLPVFRSCVQESDVSCIMCAYSAINGIPACADKGLLTDKIRGEWGFEGYIVSDCGAVDFVQRTHNYTQFPNETCHAVLDAGVDIECYAYNGPFFTRYLGDAVAEGAVTPAMLDTALANGFRVLMRLGYFEKNATRPFTDLLPPIVDSQPHRDAALAAARQSIVLLKNSPALGKAGKAPLPVTLGAQKQGTMALIGPHLNASRAFLANYHGIPSSISTPLSAIRASFPNAQYEFGCDLISTTNPHLDEAAALAAISSPIVLFVGINAAQFEEEGVEYEEHDRLNLTLTGLQPELIRTVLAAAREPVILFVVSGGVVDLSEWKDDPRVGAIIWAGYLGQAGGEAIADVLFGRYNPSGRLAQTFYSNEVITQFEKYDMNMRPTEGTSTGRTYRFYEGTPVYPFGFGLSYTTFGYSILNLPPILEIPTIGGVDQDCAVMVTLAVRNVGVTAGDHSVLWFLAPPNAGQGGRPIRDLLDFEKLENISANEVREANLCLNRDHFVLANEAGEWEVVPGDWTLQVGQLERVIRVAV
ncbi:beta-xylosidase/alpha-L-arabinofuranosidase 1-like [Folsomia candida]|uniref:beta-xylosidase/alpha-L-arabinofuranosidase 1-like n=1 Tax=Folsomia candida TaxID=158441 RepID=UPI001605242D|nr:beta-xylosidase/alpha-L-arabinofuranosidase 1-like [Folsomia candida]